MEKKGSITIFLALMLSLLLSLVCASIESVRMAAARTQILNGLDIGLYSLFGQYDRKMLEDYDLFVLDGSFGGGDLNLVSAYDNMETYMTPVFKQNSQKLSVEQGGFTGYRLLTDEKGTAFYQQIVQYMRETLGSQGLQLLIDRMRDRKETVQNAEDAGKRAEAGDSLDSYDSEMNHAAQRSQEAAEESASGEGTAPGTMQPQEAGGNPPAPVKNPITVIRRIMKMGILELVIPNGNKISTNETTKSTLVTGRNLQQGLQMPDGLTADQSYAAQILFQQYLMSRFGNYRKPAKGGLRYQAEYIFSGKDNDLDNLKSVAKKLLLVREGVNFACLAADSTKRAQAEALTLAIASGFLIPPAATAITAAILFCWSFAESILDVRELFDGGKVPLVKTSADWQISLENLPDLLEGLDSVRRGSEKGMSYEDYLQVFMMTVNREKKVMRAMDMVELSVRTTGGRPAFKMDSCITAIEASVDVKANKKKEFNVVRQYCYE